MTPPLAFARLWRTVAWLLVIAVIIVTLVPKPPQIGGTGWDKTDHLLAYGVLMWWFRQAFDKRWRWPLGLIALGVGLEILQGWFGYRYLELGDMVANSLGVAAGWLLTLTPLGGVIAWLDNRLDQRYALLASSSVVGSSLRRWRS